MLYEHDKKKLAALDIAANKKNRVTAAQYARLSGPAPSAFSSVNTTIPNGKLSVKDESTRFSLKDECAVTDRELLENTPLDAARNDGELRRLGDYKKQLDAFYAAQDELGVAENRYGLENAINAINKKQTSAEFLTDLDEARKAYARSASQQKSVSKNNISEGKLSVKDESPKR